MVVATVIAVIAVLAVAIGAGIGARQRHQRERRDVENLFSSGPEDRVWWDHP